MNDPNAADWIIASAGVVAALATAAAAWAALKSARASERTSRQAREALAAAIEPDIRVEIVLGIGSEADPSPDHFALRVVNLSRHPATDLEATVTYSGGTVREKRELLDPFPEEEDWFVAVREIPWSAFRPFAVAVRFSDAQRLARYEVSTAARRAEIHLATDSPFESEPSQKRRIK